MNAQHLYRASPFRASPTVTITAGWPAKFETLRAKLGCQRRGLSYSGSPLITTGEATISTSEPAEDKPRLPAGHQSRESAGTAEPLMAGAVLADRGGYRTRTHLVV